LLGLLPPQPAVISKTSAINNTALPIFSSVAQVNAGFYLIISARLAE
jgi:hypothetical protein